MPDLTFAEIERLRRQPGRSLLFFLTDRCPVGCDHCSVDSRPDSPRITDWDRFDAMVAGIAALPDLRLVGISGGEPFVERVGLSRATGAFSAAGKMLTVYTSGMWARGRVPRWVEPILSRADSFVLSTDSFHADAVGDDVFARAAGAIVDHGSHLIVQVLDEPETLARVDAALSKVVGPGWADMVEINVGPLLPYGRGAVNVAPPRRHPTDGFGPCHLLGAPVLRYDGAMVACCNEQVLTGHGPDRLRTRCHSAADVGDAMTAFAEDSLLKAVAHTGTRLVANLPSFAGVPSAARSMCDACWMLQSEAGELGASDPLLDAVALFGEVRACRP